MTTVERKAASGEVTGTHCRDWLSPPSLYLDPGFSAGLLSHRGVSEAPLLPLLRNNVARDFPGAFLHLCRTAVHRPTDLQSSLWLLSSEVVSTKQLGSGVVQ